LYLEVGNYADILSMSYWDYLTIANTANIKNKRRSGQPIVHEKLPQSNKDMIKRLKDLHDKH